MNRITALRAAVATVVAAAASLAQEPATHTVGRGLVTPIHTQADDRGVPYGLWAAGDDYKASFAETMTFVPYGPTDGPTPDWSWRTTSARIGDAELVQHAAVLRHCQVRAEYDLGNVVEAYDVRADGLEQTFVVSRHPGTAGDLVIRGAVTSALQPAADARGGIAWIDGHGDVRVRYGTAVAIDANGRRREVGTTPVDGGLELRLDAGWLAQAAFPLVVDPLLAPVTVSGGTTISEVAVAHDPLGAKGLWFAEVRRVGTDSDLRLIRSDADGGAPILVFSDLSASWATFEPSLGINRPAASTVVAFTRHFSDDTREVRVHVHDRLDLGLDNTYVAVPNLPGRNQWRPVVGSELSPVSFTSLLIAYQVEGTGAFSNISTSAIHGIAFACGGTGSVLAQFVISEIPGVDCERPTVAKVAIGPTRTWTVGYQRYQPFGVGGFNWDVGLRRIDAAFAVGAEAVVDNGVASQHEMSPKLAGTDGRLMLFYTASTVAESIAKPIGINGHRIRGVRLDWNGAGWSLPYGSRLLQSNADARLEIGGADFDTISQSHWSLSFRSNVTEALYLRTYGYSGLELTSDTVHTPAVALGTTIGGGVCFQANDDEFLVGYGADEPGVGSYLKLRERTWPVIGAVTTGGTSCTTTQLGWNGTRWIGSEQSGLVFENAPPGSLTLAIAATQTASLQLFGVGGVLDGCWLLVPLAGPDYLGMLGAVVGTSGSWPLALPEGLDNMVLRFQAITLDPASGLFTSSARLSVPIVK